MNELTGGIRNALETGENIQKIKQSFINAGYKSAEVEASAREAYSIPQQVQQNPIPSPYGNSQKKSLPQLPMMQTKKTWPIALIIVSVLIVILAGLIGLFWNKITGLFS